MSNQELFADLLEMKWHSSLEGESHFSLGVSDKHKNPHQVVHGGVMYSLADHGMGSALYSVLDTKESCATIELKINYFRPVLDGIIDCKTKIIYKGRKTACLESELFNRNKMIAKASGTFAIFPISRLKTGLPEAS